MYLLAIAFRWLSQDFTDDKSGNKPLPEPVLTQIHGISRPQWVDI